MSKTLYNSNYDPASYGRSYVRASVENPELYWNGNEWVRFEDKVKNEDNNSIPKSIDWGKILLYVILFLSIICVIFFAFMMLFPCPACSLLFK